MLKSTTHLYRDCLRTIEHMNGRSAKGRHIAAIVRQQFKDNKTITDDKEIETLRKKSTPLPTTHSHSHSHTRSHARRASDGTDGVLGCVGLVGCVVSSAMTSLANYLTLQSISQLRHKDGLGNPIELANEQRAEEEDNDDEYEEVWMNEHGDILSDEEAMAIQQGKPLPGRNVLKDAEVQSDTRHQ